MRRNGSATNGTSASRAAAPSTMRLRPAQRRVAVGEAAADPVAGAEGDEHRGDRVRPHDRRRPEPGREQPRGRDLRTQRGGPDDGGEQLDGAARHHGRQGTEAVRMRGYRPRQDDRRRAPRPRPQAPVASVHPAAGLDGRGLPDHRPRRRLHAVGHRRPRVHRRRLVAVVHGPRAPPPRAGHRDQGPARQGRALDDARPQPRARGAPGGRARRARAARAWSACSSPTRDRRRARSR